MYVSYSVQEAAALEVLLVTIGLKGPCAAEEEQVFSWFVKAYEILHAGQSALLSNLWLAAVRLQSAAS